jgi:hypothetical protein
MPTLFFVLAYGVPTVALLVVVYRLFKTRGLVSDARTSTVRAQARQEAAERAALVAEEMRAHALGQARESLQQTGDALAVARNIEQVGDQVQGLTEYIVDLVEGPQPHRSGRHRHALPAGQDQQSAIAGTAQTEAIP